MSEVTLHAIDQDDVRTPTAASTFVDRWVDTPDGHAHPHLDAFLTSLMDVLPPPQRGARTKKAKGVWHEVPALEPLAGPVLAMYFESSRFDEEALAKLRHCAAAHGLHVFDAEGDVVYLSDGTEAARPAPPPPPPLFDPAGPAVSPEGLRYDGLYVGSVKHGLVCLRFAQDGNVYRLSSSPRVPLINAWRSATPNYGLCAFGTVHVVGDVLRSMIGNQKLTNAIAPREMTARLVDGAVELAPEPPFQLTPVLCKFVPLKRPAPPAEPA